MSLQGGGDTDGCTFSFLNLKRGTNVQNSNLEQKQKEERIEEKEV